MKNTKKNTIKTISATELKAGKVHGLKHKSEGPYFDSYCVGAPNKNNYSFVSADENELCKRLELRKIGAVTIPEGLRAAAKFAFEHSENGFSFTFDGRDNWGLKFANTTYENDICTYENGSNEDAVGGWIVVDGDAYAKIKGLKTIFTHFATVEIYIQKASGNDKNIIFKVADVDDGRGLFCVFTFAFDELFAKFNGDYDEKMSDFINSFEPAEGDSNAPAPVEAVANVPAKKIAAMSAPKCENSDENGENTEKSAENCKNSAKNGLKIEKNADFGTVEIYFYSKPSQVVREALKTARFRWHAVKKCWYGKPENAQNVMTTSSEARAVLHAILGAFKAENVERGTGVTLDAKMAPKRAEIAENVKAPEPVDGARDFVRDIRRGDVVRISGVTGSTGKAINGLYYVETVHGAGDYWLNSLKRDRGSDFEGIGKKSHSWPLHCYANNPKVRAEFRENIKDAKIEGIGPRSAAVYSLMLRNLDELRANRDNWSNYGECYQQEQQKRADELAADLRRMREENPGLDQFAAKLDEKFKPTGPGLAIRADGLEVRDNNGTWKKYNLSMRHDGDAVIIWGSYYGRSSSATIPAGFGFDVTNNSDPYTDYHEPDGATVKQDHPLFDTLVRIIDAGRGRYELTDADAEALKAYTDAKKAAADAKREQEEAERAAKEEAKEQHAREVIAQYVELFPGDSYHPHVVVQWSELTAISEHSIENIRDIESEDNTNPNGATVFSVEAWENITGELDAYFKDDLGYNKTKFEFIDPINDRHFIDRCDIGEGTGSYGTRARHTIKWCKEHASEQYYMKDGGACCSPEEGAQEAQMYLDCIPATFDDLNAIYEA